jgi:hypothetical protein
LIEALVALYGRLASVYGVTPAQQFRLYVIRQISGSGMLQSIIHGRQLCALSGHSAVRGKTQEKLVAKPA